MNKPDTVEFSEKEKRLDEFLDLSGYDAVLMGTTANFSWLSCGGCNQVSWTTDYGCCILLVTRTNRYCIANTMDARRLEEQELAGLGFLMVSLRWYEKPVAEAALELSRGMRVLSDMPLPGVDCNFQKFYSLHYPLTEAEVARYRSMGRESEEVLRSVADNTSRGMTGSDVETLLVSGFAQRKMQIVCMIIGVDEEIGRYRHPIPWDGKIDRQLMLVLAVRRHGLHIPITRMVHFGDDIPADTRRRFDAVCTIAANTMAACRPGVKFMDMHDRQIRWYVETGFEDEWRNHFSGGLTGYIPNDSSLCMDANAVIREGQAFNWFITITGANTEDTMLLTSKGREILTCTGLWPVKKYQAEHEIIELPQILVK